MTKPKHAQVLIIRPLLFDVYCDMGGIGPGEGVYHILLGKIVDSGRGVAEMNGRITVTPGGLKKFAHLFNEHVREHELKHGEIKANLILADAEGRIKVIAPQEVKET